MRTYRVLLLAMSGVRVKDDELRRLGMSLPGFIERGRVIASLPSRSIALFQNLACLQAARELRRQTARAA